MLNVPTVIIETHHALDYEEVERWREMRTRNVFANAVTKGLLDYFYGTTSMAPAIETP